jgi:hypothetical protein
LEYLYSLELFAEFVQLGVGDLLTVMQYRNAVCKLCFGNAAQHIIPKLGALGWLWGKQLVQEGTRPWPLNLSQFLVAQLFVPAIRQLFELVLLDVVLLVRIPQMPATLGAHLVEGHTKTPHVIRDGRHRGLDFLFLAT